MPRNLKFSIVTPSYNQVSTISQTIESVVNQSYHNFEYFIYDNCSTDGSDQIIEKYRNITSHAQKDNGQADALNKGFAKASGDIFAFINSDDYYLPDTFDVVSKYFTSHPSCQWLVGNCQTNPSSFSWTFRLKEIMPYDKYPLLLYIFNFINQPAVFIRKDIFKKVGKFDTGLHYCFDYDFWLRLIKLSPPHRLHLPLAVFRISASSKGSTGYIQQFSEDYQVVQRYTDSPIIKFIHMAIGSITVNLYRILK